KNRAAALALAMILGGLSAYAGEGSVEGMPNGYIDGREDAKYGTYYSTVQQSARPFQDRLLALENKAYGLSRLSSQEPAKQAEASYLLENEIVRLHEDISSAPTGAMSDFERQALLFGTVHAYSDVRHHSERLYENMIRTIDHKIPGPNGQQIRSEAGAEVLYAPNYRTDRDLSEAERVELYAKRLGEFQAEGGSLQEIKVLSAKTLSELPRVSRMEYTWMADDEVRVTPGKAGHILLAGGKSVKCAGQIVLIKDRSGKFTMAIVTNASGSYKPDLLSAKRLAQKLEAELGIAPELVALTKGEPLSAQGVKIYMKAEKMDPALIKKKVKELEARGDEILLPKPTPEDCAAVFSAA
ncbi:MAG: hypothetical protein ACXWP5_09435, partial [Bdellovibrionota bacterium]